MINPDILSIKKILQPRGPPVLCFWNSIDSHTHQVHPEHIITTSPRMLKQWGRQTQLNSLKNYFRPVSWTRKIIVNEPRILSTLLIKATRYLWLKGSK